LHCILFLRINEMEFGVKNAFLNEVFAVFLLFLLAVDCIVSASDAPG
jgi:hypothetical protein